MQAQVTDFTLVTANPPGSDPDAKWHRYYQADYVLKNTGTFPIELDRYLFRYQADQDNITVELFKEEQRDPLLRCQQVLPCGDQMHVSQMLRISMGRDNKEEDIFPLKLYFGDYDGRLLVAQAKVVTEVAPLEP